MRRHCRVLRSSRCNRPLATYLWSQNQIDRYHKAAQEYLQKVTKEAPPAIPRWTIVVVGQGTENTVRPLFRRLMPHGTLFTQVDPAGGLETLLAKVSSRAQQHPLEYGHWYIDGGEFPTVIAGSAGLTAMSYSSLVPVTKRDFALLKQFTSAASDGRVVGVEAVRSYIAGLTPEAVGLKETATDAPLRHFEVNLLTQGAGCQIYSTTFVQWASRECLHCAQPLTLLARFATRQINAPMEQLLARDPLQQVQDKEGSGSEFCPDDEHRITLAATRLADTACRSATQPWQKDPDPRPPLR